MLDIPPALCGMQAQRQCSDVLGYIGAVRVHWPKSLETMVGDDGLEPPTLSV